MTFGLKIQVDAKRMNIHRVNLTRPTYTRPIYREGQTEGWKSFSSEGLIFWLWC